ncbi:MAG: MFS transporter, partial [Dehalococcoidia bacterium]|nr:MFS transporter [Dehalococcoidia bacterium]
MARVKEGGVYYGWVIVVVSMLAALVVSGARMSFGPSFKPMLADFDTNRGLLSLAMSLNQIFYGLAGPLMGWLTDRYGARTIILVGAVLTVAGVIGSSLSPNLWVLYVTYGLFAGFGFSGATAIPFSALITRWFHRKSGLALGLSAAGTPVGQTVLVPFSMFLILAFSWRFAYIVLGAMVALIILPLAWRFVKADPQDMGLLPDGESRSTAPSASPTAAGLGMSVNKSLAQAVRTRPYWLLCIGWFDCGFTGFLIATHFVPFATDIGMDPMRAASVFSLVGLFTIIGTFGAGAVSDRIGRKNPLT